MAHRELSSELEYLILAMVGEGTNSGYAMRCEMQRMRGGRWSAESGSVYRVLRRLETQGLIAQTGKVGVPNRERTEYALTSAGERALQLWLTAPLHTEELELLVDPIRTRTYYLHRLEPNERIKAVRAWMRQNKRLIGELQDQANGKSDHQRLWANANLLALARSRQDWLKKMLAEFKTN